MRPGNDIAIPVQSLAPFYVTILVRTSSSSLDQGALAMWLLSLSSRKRLWHLISDLPRILLIRLHAVSPSSLTSTSNFESSSLSKQVTFLRIYFFLCPAF